MAVEQHNHPELVSEINGFGERVSRVEIGQEGNRMKTDRNEKDVQKLFDLVDSNAKTLNALERSVATLIGKVSGAVAVIVALSKLIEFLWKPGVM